MKKVKGFLMMLGVLLSKKSFAAGVGGVAAGVSAQIAGFDPMPWVIATVGWVYVLARSTPKPGADLSQVRRDALANGLVSLVGGGLGGPWTAVAVGSFFENPRLESPLLMAFVISAGWQFFAYKAFPALWPIAQSWLSRKAGGV